MKPVSKTAQPRFNFGDGKGEQRREEGREVNKNKYVNITRKGGGGLQKIYPKREKYIVIKNEKGWNNCLVILVPEG